MNETEALARMVAPGTPRPGKYRQGVIQIHVTRACDKSCFSCTQLSNLRGPHTFMTPEQFEQACLSLKGYWGVVGVFGGNPAVHPQFERLCEILRAHFPREQRGLWCNNPINESKARAMRETFDPAVSNLNCHLDRQAYDNFRRWWPESRPFGLDRDSRHSPPFVAMRDVLRAVCDECSGNGGYYDRANGERYLSDPEDGTEWRGCPSCDGTGQVYDEGRAWELISRCAVNQHWSALIGVFRGELRAFFCEVAYAQAALHQDDPCPNEHCRDGWVSIDEEGGQEGDTCDTCGGTGKGYPDTGIPVPLPGRAPELSGLEDPVAWWKLGMPEFAHQVRKHCHECSVPLAGYGELSQAAEGKEQTSATHAAVYRPKRPGRPVEVVTRLEQLGTGKIERLIDYLQNSSR